MNKQKICPKCGKGFKLSKQDKAMRMIVGLNAKMFPALKEVAEKCKEYCNDCWKKEMKPSAEAVLTDTEAKVNEKG